MQQKNHRLLENSLEILELIAQRTDDPISFKEICDHIDLPKSTIYHLVQTLVNLDFCQKDESTGEFTIGLRSFEVGNAYLSSNPFYVKAKEIIEAVSIKCNETTHFAILDGTDVVYLFKFDSSEPLRIFSYVGKRMPAHATAIGKALLSGYDDESIRRLYSGGALPSVTPNTITSVDTLVEQIKEVRKSHVAYEKEESSPYIQCYAVPVANKQGAPVAGISISIPIYREESAVKKLIPLLLEAKKQLESVLRLYE